jgi:uncharacterized protein YgiM (DUF1202 family)
MRVSPHGRAPELGPLESGGAVRILRSNRAWLLVRAGGAREGWVVSDAIASIGG